ncbi:MAG: hypothetical protein PHU63_00095 [Candidatus ainarchaeum sp.]|nr:hypothetical protein [Candidatus ainarchaeum sp.]
MKQLIATHGKQPSNAPERIGLIAKIGLLGGRRLQKNQIIELFDRMMGRVGFGRIVAKDIDGELRKHGLIGSEEKTGVVKANEVVYNLGVGKARSNFFVYFRENEGNVEVVYTNPRADEGALFLPPEEIFIKRVLNPGSSEREVARVVNEIVQTAAYKGAEDYRMQVHFHANHLFRSSDVIFDDGGSKMADILRRLMVYNTDVFCPTPHNSSNERMHRMLKSIGRAIGMTYVPGFELTMTVGVLNGPHVVIMCDSIRTVEMVRREILERRDPDLKMPPYFSGMHMIEMFRVLEPLRKKGKVALLVAHGAIQEMHISDGFLQLLERNGHGLDPRLHITGMFSAVETGLLEPFEAIGFARMCTSIAAFNNLSSHDRMQVGNYWLANAIPSSINEFFGPRSGVVATPNAVNMAFAHLFSRIGLDTHYESDEHETKPFGGRDGRSPKRRSAEYLLGGDGFGAGFTRVLMAPTLVQRLTSENRKPKSIEIVGGMERKEVRLSAVVFSEVDEQGVLRIVKSRSANPKYRFWEKAKLKFRRFSVYIKGMVKTIINFIVNNKWFELRRLTK